MIETIRTFTALSEEFVELFMKHHPVAATEAGIHDYDHLMPDDTPEGLQGRAMWLRDLDQRLVAAVPWEELPLEPRVDFALLRSRIAALRADLEEIKVPQKNPTLYLERAFSAVHLLLARSFAPLDERKEAAVSRLMAVPEYLEAVKPNLLAVPPVMLAASLEMAAEGPTFVDDVVRLLLRQFPGEAERLEHAGNRARAGFLRVPRLDGEGAQAPGDRLVRHRRALAQLQARTRAHGALRLRRVGACGPRTRGARAGAARGRGPPARRAPRLARADRPGPPAHARSELAARVLRRPSWTERSASWPSAASRRCRPATGWRCWTRLCSSGACARMRPYQAPAPFDADPAGVFYVTPIDIRRPKDEQAAQLAAHCMPALPILALHEGYPGHHLQLTHANRAATRLRRIVHSDVFAEGWALYCEELMWEQGYFTADPLTRLFQLRDLLFRACRVVVDMALHSGRMTPEQAVAYLVEEVMLDPPSRRRRCSAIA